MQGRAFGQALSAGEEADPAGSFCWTASRLIKTEDGKSASGTRHPARIRFGFKRPPSSRPLCTQSIHSPREKGKRLPLLWNMVRRNGPEGHPANGNHAQPVPSPRGEGQGEGERGTDLTIREDFNGIGRLSMNRFVAQSSRLRVPTAPRCRKELPRRDAGVNPQARTPALQRCSSRSLGSSKRNRKLQRFRS
jgi:hypothetical protein